MTQSDDERAPEHLDELGLAERLGDFEHPPAQPDPQPERSATPKPPPTDSPPTPDPAPPPARRGTRVPGSPRRGRRRWRRRPRQAARQDDLPNQLANTRERLRELARTRAGRVRIVATVLVMASLGIGALAYNRMLDNAEREGACSLWIRSDGTLGVPDEIRDKRLRHLVDEIDRAREDGRPITDTEPYPGPSIEAEMAAYCLEGGNPYGLPALIAAVLGLVLLVVGWIAFGKLQT